MRKKPSKKQIEENLTELESIRLVRKRLETVKIALRREREPFASKLPLHQHIKKAELSIDAALNEIR